MRSPAQPLGDDDTPPPLPGISLSQVFAVRDAIVDGGFNFFGVNLRESGPVALAAYIQSHLGKLYPLTALIDTVASVATADFLREDLFKLAWRVAGNMRSLRRGRAVLPWTLQRAVEWVPVEIIRVMPGLNKYNRRVADCLLQVQAGTPCPLRFTKRLSQAHYSFWAREFGYTSSFAKPPMPFNHQSELVGLRFYALLEPALSNYDVPGFKRVRVTAGQIQGNRELIRVRCRVEPCPNEYEHSCHKCSLGRNACPYATHPLTYQYAACSVCEEAEAPFDTTMSTTMCVLCDTHRRYRPPEK